MGGTCINYYISNLLAFQGRIPSVFRVILEIEVGTFHEKSILARGRGRGPRRHMTEGLKQRIENPFPLDSLDTPLDRPHLSRIRSSIRSSHLRRPQHRALILSRLNRRCTDTARSRGAGFRRGWGRLVFFRVVGRDGFGSSSSGDGT